MRALHGPSDRPVGASWLLYRAAVATGGMTDPSSVRSAPATQGGPGTTTSYDDRGASVDMRRSEGTTSFVWRPSDGAGDEIEMARWDPAAGLLTVFPMAPAGERLEPPYSRVERLEIAADSLLGRDPEESVGENDAGNGLELSCLPDGFSRVFRYGLRLKRRYGAVVRHVEEHTACTAVRLTAAGPEGPDGDVFRIRPGRFDAFRKTVDRNRARARVVAGRINDVEAHNAVADVLGMDPRRPTVGRHPVVVAMTRELTDSPVLDSDERRLLVRQASKESRAAARESPEEFGRLRRDIEFVSLDVLIDQFDKSMTGSASKDEGHWQQFFEDNTFALQQLFAAPVALYGPQLTVRSANAHGRGSRVADFVLVNTVLRTALVVEIKTPAAGLVGAVHRGTDGAEVHLPHRDVLGAVAQVQSQMESVRSDLPGLLRRTPGAEDMDTSHVRGAVIVGTAGGLGAEEKASYLRHRAGLADVAVLAFDEVRDRLALLRSLLAPTGPTA